MLGLVIAGAVIAMAFLILTKPNSPTSKNEEPRQSKRLQPPKAESAAYVPGLPMRIVIPKIGVDAPIEGLGLTAEGDLDDPVDITKAGWYNAGPRAGSPGSAVIDGHYGGTKSKPAVFDDLHTLVKGDQIQVVDSDKRTHTFIIRETRTYLPEQDASDVFRSADNKSHLNLITCQGQWVDSKESYTTRLVVFADLLEE